MRNTTLFCNRKKEVNLKQRWETEENSHSNPCYPFKTKKHDWEVAWG